MLRPPNGALKGAKDKHRRVDTEPGRKAPYWVSTKIQTYQPEGHDFTCNRAN